MLLVLDDFPQKNDLWVFRAGPVELTYESLYKIRDFVIEHYPKDSKGHKTALVVETGFLAGLAETYADLIKDISVEIKIFFDIRDAEEWLGK